VACFISSHGLGHAARAAAVMAEMQRMDPSIRFHVFGRVPSWFLESSLPGPVSLHEVMTDMGMVQSTPLEEDLSATVEGLREMLPFDEAKVGDLAREVGRLGCQLVLCDIAPLGIAVARAAGVRSVLVENFTWDWIYRAYADQVPEMERFAGYLGDLFDQADYRIQTEPVCRRFDGDFITRPVSRRPRTPRDTVRSALGIPEGAEMVMVTMGGVSGNLTLGKEGLKDSKAVLVIPGGGPRLVRRDNVIYLPYQSQFFHPDLIRACDAVVGKVGYSTLAEVYHAGVPFGYVARPRFPESGPLVAFIRREMPGVAIPMESFLQGKWGALISELTGLKRVRRSGPNGSEEAAGFLMSLLDGESSRSEGQR
jgi:hypothetical protein